MTYVTELCRRVAEANPTACFLQGRRRGLMLLENGILAFLFLVMVAVFLWLRPRIHQYQWLQFVLILVYVPLAIGSYRRNRSGTFDPLNPPGVVLPEEEP
jgi:hypothetical protein